MPSDKYDLIGRVKAVEREHTALRFTTDHVLKSLGEGLVFTERLGSPAPAARTARTVGRADAWTAARSDS